MGNSASQPQTLNKPITQTKNDISPDSKPENEQVAYEDSRKKLTIRQLPLIDSREIKNNRTVGKLDRQIKSKYENKDSMCLNINTLIYILFIIICILLSVKVVSCITCKSKQDNILHAPNDMNNKFL